MAEEHERPRCLINSAPKSLLVCWSVGLLCLVFEVTRSCCYAYCRKRRSPDIRRLALRSRVSELFTQSRSAAGSQSIMFMMREDGIEIGRFKVHAYKNATVERPDIPNVLDREFTYQRRKRSSVVISLMCVLKAPGIFTCCDRSFRAPRCGLGIFNEARC